MFPLDFTDISIGHYDVTIMHILKDGNGKESLQAEVNRQVILHLQKQINQKATNVAVYDGQKNLFTPLAFEPKAEAYKVTFVELDEVKESTFKIKIKKVSQIDLNRLVDYLAETRHQSISAIDYPADNLMVLEVLLRSSPSSRYITSGMRSGGAFYTPDSTGSLPQGLNVHAGWYQGLKTVDGMFSNNTPRPGSATQSYKRLLLNVDVANTTFYQSGPLIDVVTSYFGQRRPQDLMPVLQKDQVRSKLGKFLFNVGVETTYVNVVGRRHYKIRGISSKPASQIAVDIEGVKTTVAEYFQNTYNLKLQYPWMPCIQAGANGKVNIPFELCSVRPNQRHKGKISDDQAAAMIKVTAAFPPIREKRINDGISSLHGSNDAQLLNAWGVTIAPKMVEVNARMLNAPTILFANNQPLRVNNGSWRIDEGRMFSTGCTLAAWSIVVLGSERDCNLQAVDKFGFALDDLVKKMGMNVYWPDDLSRMVTFLGRNDIETTLLNAENQAIEMGKEAAAKGFTRSNNRKIDMIMCIIIQRNVYQYSEVKRIAECRMDAVTQCVLSKHVFAAKIAYCANLALKINVKLGGVNSHIDAARELPVLGAGLPTMIFGADVTHTAGAGGALGNSIAAVVASIDRRFAEYRASIRQQSGRKEIIEELFDMACELMLLFKDRGGVFPQRIIFYRDGVSDGEKGTVVVHEVQALKKACEKLGIKKMAITFLCVTKRHHVRFFGSDRKDVDKNGNVLPGMCVDTGIVDPFEYDFFLNSHAGLASTSKASHYHVLYDEIGFTPDSLQSLSYKLCYLYCRATKAVSMVPPAYYAHLVAARAKCHQGVGSDTASMQSFASSTLDKVMSDIERSMYFV